MIDLSKMSDAEIADIARQVFDIMMICKLNPEFYDGGRWGVDCAIHMLPEPLYSQMTWEDPFTAIIEAAKYMNERMVNNVY